MPPRRALGPAVLVAASMSWGCAASPPPPVAPPPAEHGAHEPEVEHTFVSTSNNDGARATRSTQAEGVGTDCTVTTPEAARALAETAVAEHLDPQKTWTTSPVLPVTWPAPKRAVVYFFYPMAANPRSMSHFQLFSAAWRVEVSLHDGSTSVAPVAKSREIGTITQTRPSSLERRELEIAEAALVQQLVGTGVDEGESPYWGYLKFMHEHPQIGKDLQRRSPAFLGWVRKRYGK
ncbi:MAG: hypothetical protein JNK45_09820 [Myxococcales bacterium]|nr:hypothetical protein [Myxococcales bacterium]